MGFWGGLFGGQNENLNKDIGATSDIAGFATGLGKKDISTASKFWNDIVSGDSTKTMQALAPEVSALKTSAQQQNKTNAEFNTRSGGTAASTGATNDKLHAEITNLVGSLTNNAVSNLASTGSNLLSTGLSSFEANEKFSQDQLANWKNSILGNAISSGVKMAETAGMGAVAGALPGGPGAAAGSQGALSTFFNG